MLGKIIQTSLLGLTLVASASAFNLANAAEDRKPMDYNSVRETTAEIESYENEITIVRHRSSGKTLASFHADPQLIDQNSMMIFEVKSHGETGSVSRWRCIAIHDVAECLGSPVKIRYLPEDTRIEMSFRLKPKLKRERRQAYAGR